MTGHADTSRRAQGAPRLDPQEVPLPSYLLADDPDPWAYYIPGHDPAELWAIDDPEELEYERLWMKPERVSSVDLEERGDGWESLTRDRQGRFQPAYCWTECRETHPHARPFMGARYRP